MLDRGFVQKDKTALEYGLYPWGYAFATREMALKLWWLVERHRPDAVVIEETNQTKSRYVQKQLEWIHLQLMTLFINSAEQQGKDLPVYYISTGTWKSTLGLKKPADAKVRDQMLKKAKAQAGGDKKKLAELKKQLGIRGKWNKKMLAVDWVNENYGLKLKLVNNDEAEAICLGVAYFKGALLCDGDPNRGD